MPEALPKPPAMSVTVPKAYTESGCATSDEFSISGGRRSNFQHGYITWDAATLKTTVHYT
jgi:LGFP repeat